MSESPKRDNEKFCHECGSAINAKAEICPKCGVRQLGMQAASGRNKTVAGLLALFLGGLGIHKFYLGKGIQGVFYLLLCWTFIPAVIALFEGIWYLLQSEESFRARFG